VVLPGIGLSWTIPIFNFTWALQFRRHMTTTAHLRNHRISARRARHEGKTPGGTWIKLVLNTRRAAKLMDVDSNATRNTVGGHQIRFVALHQNRRLPDLTLRPGMQQPAKGRLYPAIGSGRIKSRRDLRG
jgi:hypothetical protein